MEKALQKQQYWGERVFLLEGECRWFIRTLMLKVSHSSTQLNQDKQPRSLLCSHTSQGYWWIQGVKGLRFKGFKALLILSRDKTDSDVLGKALEKIPHAF